MNIYEIAEQVGFKVVYNHDKTDRYIFTSGVEVTEQLKQLQSLIVADENSNLHTMGDYNGR